MAIDNTHTKYLHGHDKKVWTNYKDAYESMKKYDNLMAGFNIPDLKEGEEYEIPVKGGRKKK